MNRRLHRYARCGGMTLLEILTVIVVIAILVTMAMPGFSAMANKMERAKCTMNLKALYLGAEFYLQDKMHWPQIDPQLLTNKESDEYARQWMDVLQPYRVAKETWHCPTVAKEMALAEKGSESKKERIDYFPTPFDSKQITPHRWTEQPWFIERGAVHDTGNLMIFPDGSIKTLDEIIAKRKKK